MIWHLLQKRGWGVRLLRYGRLCTMEAFNTIGVFNMTEVFLYDRGVFSHYYIITVIYANHDINSRYRP